MRALLLYYNTDKKIWLGQYKSDTLRNLDVVAVFKVSKKIPYVIATVTIIKIITTNMIITILKSSHLRLTLCR